VVPSEPFNGAPPEAFDHDGDGKPGGSLKRTLHAPELNGLSEEAFYAYDMQTEQIRFDTLGRRWEFRPDVAQPGNRACLLLEVKRLDTVKEYRIANDQLGINKGQDLIADAVASLDEAVR